MKRLTSVEEIIEAYAVTSSPIKSKLCLGFGILFALFAIIGIWIPGWPTVSWAVPAAFLFSLSSERLFRWSLTNPYFGPALFEYYATGKTIPKHVKFLVVGCITLMTVSSAYFIYLVSYPADPGYGPGSVLLVGLVGVIYVSGWVQTK